MEATVSLLHLALVDFSEFEGLFGIISILNGRYDG